MKNRNDVLVILLAVALPLCLEFSNLPHLLGSTGLMYTIIWMLVNYLFLRTCIEMTKAYGKILRLPEVQVSKATYFLNFILYWIFLVYLNSYFVQQLYIRDRPLVNAMANPLIAIAILVLFVINLFFGIFPEVKPGETRIVEVSSQSSFRHGREKFGTVVGSYREGIVLGTESFSFDSMKSISSNRKQESLVLKGKDDIGNYRVNISAPKSADKIREIIVEARDSGKLDAKKVNIQ